MRLLRMALALFVLGMAGIAFARSDVIGLVILAFGAYLLWPKGHHADTR